MAQQVKSGSQKVDVRALPGLRAVEAKAQDGARPDEFDEMEREVIGRKAFLEDEARILAAIALEPEAPRAFVPKQFGAFADSVQKFVVVHEQVTNPYGDVFRRRDVVTYRELCEFDTTRDLNNLHSPDFTRPRIAKTKANVERLLQIGAIRPLFIVGNN